MTSRSLKHSFSAASIALASGCFGVVFLTYALGLFLLTLDRSLNGTLLVASLIVSTAVVVWIALLEELALSVIPLLLMAFLAIVWASFHTASIFVDLSWDGQAYHQEAIIRLAKGWNPYYQNLGNDVPHKIWLEHYPKATWIFGAIVYLFTNNIEYGKAYHLILAETAFLLVFAVVLRMRNSQVFFATLIGILAAANPVVIYQSLSFYVDGALSSSITAIVALSVMLFISPSWGIALFWLLIGILTVNLKFTGIPYISIIGLGVICMAVISKRFDVVRFALIAIVGAIAIGVALFGYDPYIRNIIIHNNPFFPLRGEGAIDIMACCTPDIMKSMGQIEKLRLSLFHESTNSLALTPQLKIPFSVSQKEIGIFAGADVRIGGLGPFFGGILLLAIGTASLLVISPKSKWASFPMLAAIIVLTATILLNPEAWWARYVPQLWLIPVIVCATLLISVTTPARIAGLGIGFLMLANTGLISREYYRRSLWKSESVRAELLSLSRYAKPIPFYFGPFPAVRVRLERAGIPIIPINKSDILKCADPRNLPSADGEISYCAGGVHE